MEKLMVQFTFALAGRRITDFLGSGKPLSVTCRDGSQPYLYFYGLFLEDGSRRSWIFSGHLPAVSNWLPMRYVRGYLHEDGHGHFEEIDHAACI